MHLELFLAYVNYKSRMAKVQRVKEGEAPAVDTFSTWSATSFTATQIRIRHRAAESFKNSTRTSMGRRSEWS